MTDGTGRFLEMIQHADDARLAAAFQPAKITPAEKRVMEIVDKCYNNTATVMDLAELRRQIPALPAGTQDEQGSFAEAYTEGRIASRGGVVAELSTFYNTFGK